MADYVHESWWLVEATFAPVPLYFAGPLKNGKPNMVAEASGAVRFPDEDSATRTICLVLGIKVGMGAVLAHWGYAVREHIFDYTPRTDGVPQRVAGAEQQSNGGE